MRVKYIFRVLLVVLILWSGGFLTVSCNSEKKNIYELEITAPGPTLYSHKLEVFNSEEEPDIILSAFKDPEYQEWVVSFFQELTGSSELAMVILSNADAFKISPALAFSLCWEESRYNSRAINHNRNDTVDRGLFQLNSASFPNLEIEDFYNPAINVKYGLAHLRWCFDSAGTEVSALAMYNAGHGRVRSSGTPKSTLDYISRILKRQRKIEELFVSEYTLMTITKIRETNEKDKQASRLSLFSPFKH